LGGSDGDGEAVVEERNAVDTIAGIASY